MLRIGSYFASSCRQGRMCATTPRSSKFAGPQGGSRSAMSERQNIKRQVKLSVHGWRHKERPIGVAVYLREKEGGGGWPRLVSVVSLLSDVNIVMTGQDQPQIHIRCETRNCPHQLPGFDNHMGVQSQGAPFVWKRTCSKNSGESAVWRTLLSLLLPRRFGIDGLSSPHRHQKPTSRRFGQMCPS